MVLTDDDFSTIVAAVEEGRRVFDNVRKFVLYIFAHATPEVVPFLVFALSGGAVPLPADRHADPGDRPGHRDAARPRAGPRAGRAGHHAAAPRGRAASGVVDRELLVRAWVWMGLLSAAPRDGGVLRRAAPGGLGARATTSATGAPLHDAYMQATTMSFLGIVACQVGTAVAARTETRVARARWACSPTPSCCGASPSRWPSRPRWSAIPLLQPLFGTAPPPPWSLALLLPFPVLVWGADELRRAVRRRRCR